MPSVDVKDLTYEDVAAARATLARAFRDSPSTRSMFGQDALHRLESAHDLFSGIDLIDPPTIAARLGSLVLGVCAASPPGRCIAHAIEPWREAPPTMLTAEQDRVRTWLFSWADHDYSEPHWHLGPVGVDPIAQGMGVGSAMLSEFCRRMEEARAVAWLETDKPRNVALYERFGFVVEATGEILGEPNWWMRRAPAA